MLTDTAVKKAKAGAKAFKLYDTGGMFLLVTPTGARLWHLKFRFAGKEKLLALGQISRGHPCGRQGEARNAAMRRLGIDGNTASGHGFRATARTLLDEVLGFRVDLIEAQLAHAVRDPNGRAYNRTSFLADRKTMMQRWADYLDTLAVDVPVIPFKRADGSAS